MKSGEQGKVLSAPYVLEYTYRRSVGPVVGRFFAALQEGKILGGRTASGKVVVPPTEYDPETSDAVTDLVVGRRAARPSTARSTLRVGARRAGRRRHRHAARRRRGGPRQHVDRNAR